MCAYKYSCLRGQRPRMDSLGQEFQVVVSSLTWVPGTESRSSEKADITLDYCCTIFPSAQFKLSDWGSESGRLTNFRAIFIDTKNLMLSVCFSTASPIMSHREIVPSLPNDPFQFSLISLTSSAPARTLSSGAIEVFYVISF